MTSIPPKPRAPVRISNLGVVAELASMVVVLAACLCVTVLALHNKVDSSVAAAVLTGAIGWAGGHALGIRTGGVARATDAPDG